MLTLIFNAQIFFLFPRYGVFHDFFNTLSKNSDLNS